MSQPSLRISDFSDRELIAIVNQIAGQEGGATTDAIATEIWPRAMRDGNEDGQFHARAAVSSRMNWMRRFKLADRGVDADGKRVWTLTDVGRAFLNAHDGGVGNWASAVPDMDIAAAMNAIGRRYSTQVDQTAADVIRREWQFAHAQRRG